MAKELYTPIDVDPARMFVLTGDRKMVRLNVPPLRVASSAQRLRIHLDFDAGTIDNVLERLKILRAEMLRDQS
jgi:hypothetical protein